MIVDFGSFSIFTNLLVMVISGALTWFAGSHAAAYTDSIAGRTRLGSAFAGLILLALITETPEIATTITSTSIGNAPLALNNLFGGVMTQTAMLVVGDAFLRRAPLTHFLPNPVLAIQGQLLILLLGFATGFILIGEVFSIFNVGLWSFLLVLAYLGALFLSRRYEKGEKKWQVTDDTQALEEQEKESQGKETNEEQRPIKKLILLLVLMSVLILVNGYILARVADALADQTGLGASFVGVTLLATVTSLPELSTVIGAVRLGNPSLAISNIFGSNMIMVCLIFLSDVFYRDEPILNSANTPVIFAGVMGMVMTTIYLFGITERSDRKYFRLGIDSIAVLIVYLAGLVGLYLLR